MGRDGYNSGYLRAGYPSEEGVMPWGKRELDMFDFGVSLDGKFCN
jgi:hypothetical protein